MVEYVLAVVHAPVWKTLIFAFFQFLFHPTFGKWVFRYQQNCFLVV